MPAPRRVRDEAVKEAIHRWQGNVSAAADALGIQPKNLRIRLETLGIGKPELAALRAKGSTARVAPFSPNVTDQYRPDLSVPTARPAPPGVPRSAGPYQSPDEPPNFRGMPAAVDETELPTPTAERRKVQPCRLEPPNLDRVNDARRQLSALLGVDLTNSDILNSHFADTFEPWLETQLAKARSRRRVRPQGPPEKKGGGE